MHCLSKRGRIPLSILLQRHPQDLQMPVQRWSAVDGRRLDFKALEDAWHSFFSGKVAHFLGWNNDNNDYFDGDFYGFNVKPQAWRKR